MINSKSAEMCIETLEKETLHIIKQHGYFNSFHEFYGVLLEEFEETMENSDEFYSKMNKLWLAIRKDDTDCIKLNADRLYQIAFDNLCEWVQVCAVIVKYKKGGLY